VKKDGGGKKRDESRSRREGLAWAPWTEKAAKELGKSEDRHAGARIREAIKTCEGKRKG